MYEFIGIGIQPSVVKVKELSEGTKVAFDDFFDEFGISEILEVLFLFFCHVSETSPPAPLLEGRRGVMEREVIYLVNKYEFTNPEMTGLTEDNRQPMVTNKLIKTNLLNS